MADSTVTFTNIDEEFPIAGQDNDTQGFRDNFSEIKQGLQAANVELTDLITNVARLDGNNGFLGNEVSNADFLGTTEKVFNTSNINSNDTIEWSNGLFQNVTVTDDVTLTLDEWSDNGRLSKMRLAIRSDGASRTITWDAANAGTIRVLSSTFPSPFVVDSGTDPVIIDVWTSDGGANVYIEYIGKFTVLS